MPGHFGRHGLLLFLAVIALSLPQAALLPLLDRDEPRFAEASREMRQSGDFIVPTFDHAPRYAKPPLVYWCQVASFTVFGENAFAARLPSLVATAGTALLLYLWGARLVSEIVGLGAALSYAFCLQAVQQGRVATADALLIFFMTGTAFAGWGLLIPGRRFDDRDGPPVSHRHQWPNLNVFLTCGLAGGFLAKGPEAFLPFLPLLFCAPGTRSNIVPRLLLALILAWLIVSFWAIPAYIQSHGDYVNQGLREGIWDRTFNGLQGHGASNFGWYLLSLPLYLLLFWLSALPWSPLLAIYRHHLFPAWKRDVTDNYLLLNAALIFVVFSLMVTKLPHYTLPAFPFLALLLARRWACVGLSPMRLAWLAGGFGLTLALLTAALVPLALANHASPSPTGELVHEARDVLGPDTEFALVDFQEPNAIWEMRRVCRGYGHDIPPAEVVRFLNQPGPRAVLLSSPAWQNLRHGADPTWRTFAASGWNTAKGWDAAKGGPAFINLTLVVKP